MFCTNCGEEMRDTDKFCAVCGTPAAAPRTNRRRVNPQPEHSTPVNAPPDAARLSQSTAEAFSVPVREVRPDAVQSKPREERVSERPVEPARPVAHTVDTGQRPVSEEEQRMSLMEAEEIAAARGIMPIEALPDPFPAPPKKVSPHVAATRTCPTCGKLNPETNAFCESCGRKLAGSLNPPADVSAGSSPGWLHDMRPATTGPAALVALPVVPDPAPAATAPVTSAPPSSIVQPAHDGLGHSFSYYYDDKRGQAGSPKLLFVLLGVLALGIIGIFYLILRPSPRGTVAGNISVRISPTQAQVAPGNAFDFAATVSGSGDTDVNWSVQEGSSGGKVVNRGAQARGGEVSNLAVYIAPSTPGTYHVVAVSKADPKKAASAEVTVEPK